MPILEIAFSLQACQSDDKNKSLNAGSIGLAGLSLACDCYAFSNPPSLMGATGIALYNGAKKALKTKV